MKMLLLIDSLGIGGAETHVYDLARELSLLGHSVTVASAGGELSRRLCECGVRHIKIRFFTCGVILGVRDYFRLRSLVNREKFDIIHAHSRRAAFVGERIARSANIPFVTTAHAKFSVSPIKKYMSRWGYYVNAVSEDIATYLSEAYEIAAERITVIPNGVDTERFAPEIPEREGGERKIVFVSRLDADCSAAAYALCRMAERLSLRYGKIKIMIVGGGGEYTSLLLLSEHMNRILGYHAIELCGGLSEVGGVLKGADVFVGVSRAALEAMSMGINTVLAGNEGFFGIVTSENINRAARDNFCGRESGRFGEELLFEAITGVLDMPPAAALEQSDAVRRYIQQNHSAAECAKKTVDFYRAAIGGSTLSSGGSCLCGYYGFGNVGDDTLLREAIKRCRTRFEGGICALTRAPRRDRYTFGVRCINRSNIFSVWREIARSERLIFGGGTLFQDRTSLRSLIYYCAIAELAHIHGLRIELWGNGLGEIKSRVGRAMLRRVLKDADYVGLRDKHSVDYALSLALPKSKISFEDDLAYAVSPIESARARALCSEEIKRRILVAVSGHTSKDVYRKIREEINKQKAAGADVLIISMYPKEDQKISEKLSLDCEIKHVFGLGGGEVLYLCERAELCISTRLHLLIFADIAGCDLIGGGDDPKIISFCKEKNGQII